MQSQNTENTHYRVYTLLTELKNKSEALKSGSLKTKNLDNNALAVIREAGNEMIVLIINFKDNEKYQMDLRDLITITSNSKVSIKIATVNSGLTTE